MVLSWYFEAQLEVVIRGRTIVPRLDKLYTSVSEVLIGLSELLYRVRDAVDGPVGKTFRFPTRLGK